MAAGSKEMIARDAPVASSSRPAPTTKWASAKGPATTAELHDYSHVPFATLSQPLGPHPSSDTDDSIYKDDEITLHISQDTGGLPGKSERVMYQITDPNDPKHPLVFVHGPGRLASGAKAKKTFTSASGDALFTLETRVRTMRETFCADSPLGPSHGFEIRREYDGDGAESTITFTNAADGQPMELGIRADHRQPFLWIVFEGKPVARIKRVAMLRGWGMTESLSRVLIKGWKLEYEAVVAANMDLSLISAVCVCLEGLKYGYI